MDLTPSFYFRDLVELTNYYYYATAYYFFYTSDNKERMAEKEQMRSAKETF